MRTVGLLLPTLSACATALAPAAAPTPIAAPARPRSEVACVLEDDDVAFETPLMLLHELPRPGAMVEHPFADVSRARHLRVGVPATDGDDAPLRVAVETAMLLLDGVAHSERLVVFPAGPSTFGGVVTPLAGHRLRVHGASAGSLRLALSPPPQLRVRAGPEWRDCSYARLRPVAPFAAEPRPLPSRARLAPGQWSLYASPRAPGGSLGTLDLPRPEDLAVIEERDERWVRVLWTGGETAVIAWVDRRYRAAPPLGHGSGASAGHLRTACRNPVTCPSELRLVADDLGLLRDIGRAKAGALVTLGPASGRLTRVVVCDPEVRWADGVPILAPTEELADCATATR